MIFKLQYWFKSESIDKEVISINLDYLMNFIEARNNNGEAWLLLADKNVYVGGEFIANPKKEDLIINDGWFTVGESEEYRSVLTEKIKSNKIYKEKGIDILRDEFIKKYDEKNLKSTK